MSQAADRVGQTSRFNCVMSGVQNFTLVDNDTLGSENVIRHICGRSFVGQKKVDAVASVLLDRNPNANIVKIDADIMSYPDLDAEVRKSHAVVLATDNEPSRYTINEICVRNAVPFVVGRVFTRGIGGEVFAFRPPAGGCLACLESRLERTQFREGIKEIDLVSEEEREKVYGMEIEEIKDSPGLAVDIAFISAFHTRFILDAIARQLNERPKYLTPIDENYVVWGNRPVHPFNKHFQLQRITLDAQAGCAVCSSRSSTHV
ncbi:ThiF family adenylyltransferase (plasmid) [Mesorhizobium sp. AR10]|uniref:ThiF family adenylyltransferase n=1 Tax=Mesorhizobium sp. AR10 TaxID=2865839 RepID=UPI00215F7C0C|nr:ThiF family adenylyltransferase [Mesorhizobium sp. AR10]UVK35826.1 ThiF family adenylyltransferase [Mesorhizobium sp. AR10]